MSENLDLVRSLFSTWVRGDFSSTAWADADIAFEAHGFDAASSKGVAAMAAGWREWMRAWSEYRVEVDEFREVDDSRVLVLIRHGGRGTVSGVATPNMKPGANVFELRDAKVVRLALYWERADALADLGLEE
jgi:hypothetical protein